jgi:hypothetical protein
VASGDTLLEFGPLSAELPATLYATFGSRNNHPTLEFDPATLWNAFWSAVLPHNYSAVTGLTVDVYWISTSITGNCIWLGAFEYMDAADDLTTDTFAATQTVTTAAPGTTGNPATSTLVFTNAQIDGLIAGGPFRFRLQRDAANGSDTMANNAQVLLVVIRET